MPVSNTKNIVFQSQGISQWLEGYRDKWQDFYPSEQWAFERLAGPLKSLGTVLDVGCGMGGLALALGEKFKVAHYHGVDINQPVITRAVGSKDKFKVPVTFECQDICQAKHLKPVSYDIVFSLSCADWNIETKKIIDHCWSYVKPGGYFAISLRLTPQAGVNDITRSFQNIAHDDKGNVTEVANYVVFNGDEFLNTVKAFSPKPSEISGYGYWGKPSSNAVTLYPQLAFGVIIVRKALNGDASLKLDLNFPQGVFTHSNAERKTMIEPKVALRELTRTPIAPEDRIGKVHRLDRNERTTAFPEEHLRKILSSVTIDEMVAYPEVEPFYNKLAKWLRVQRDELLIASGSDTSIKMVFEVYVQEGDEVVVISPTYGMYVVYCKMFGAVCKEVFYNGDMSLPIERVLAAIGPKTKLVAIANPNHTGTVIAQEDLLKVIQAAQKVNALVLIDEAYHHFYPGTMINHIREYDNLIIVRTFSKGFGVAPLRIGYTVSNANIIKQLYKVKQTHDITFFSAKVGDYLLDHPAIMTDYVDTVNKAKEVLYKRLPAMGFEVLKSEANFVFFKCPSNIDAKKLLADLEKQKIILKGPFSQIPFTGHLRVTVGSPEQMNMVCDAIKGLI